MGYKQALSFRLLDMISAARPPQVAPEGVKGILAHDLVLHPLRGSSGLLGTVVNQWTFGTSVRAPDLRQRVAGAPGTALFKPTLPGIAP